MSAVLFFRFSHSSLFLVFLSMFCWAMAPDAIRLKDGQVLRGQILAIDSASVGLVYMFQAEATASGPGERKALWQGEISEYKVDGITYLPSEIPPKFQAMAPAFSAMDEKPISQAQPHTMSRAPILPERDSLRSVDSLRRPFSGLFLERKPQGALLCAMVLPGGGALYNEKKGLCIVHTIFQLAIPGIFLAIPSKDNTQRIFAETAIVSFSISKILDMYKSVIDAQRFNKKMAFNENLFSQP